MNRAHARLVETYQQVLEIAGFNDTEQRMHLDRAQHAAWAIWEDGWDAGSDDETAHQRGITLDELNQHTPNPYEVTPK